MFKKLSILLFSMIALSACASDYYEGERLGECIKEGNVHHACDLKTIVLGDQK